MTTSTVIAALQPLPQQALFSPAVRMVLGDVTEVQVDQNVQFDRDGVPLRVTYATGRGQGLLASVVEGNGSGHVLPPADFVALPSCVPAYTLLTLETPRQAWSVKPAAVDLHAWLLVRITDFLETAGVKWLWTSTGPWSKYCDWRDDLYPTAPLGDPFLWEHLHQGVG